MRIEPFVTGMQMHFVVKAENAADRAILTQFCRSSRWQTHEFRFGGCTYECDHSATTAFNFGWVDKTDLPKPASAWRRVLRWMRKR